MVLYMSNNHRREIIERHTFFVVEARQRLLSQFGDIDKAADKFGEAWRDANQHNNTADDQEECWDAICNFHQLLSEMKRITYLNVVSGIFNEWEKQLRDWLASELRAYNPPYDHIEGSNSFPPEYKATKLEKILREAKFHELQELVETFNSEVDNKGSDGKPALQECLQKIKACNLVVNIYKHGTGSSFDTLKKDYPQYLIGPKPDRNRHYTHLTVTEEQFEEFNIAIKNFWNLIPENITEGCLSGRLEDALTSDEKERKKRHSTQINSKLKIGRPPYALPSQ